MTSPPPTSSAPPPAHHGNDLAAALDSLTVDVPPPPYSETDIYSSTSPGGHPRSPRSAVPNDDSASRLSSSATTAAGDVIYTPPLTPRTDPSAALYFEDRPAPPSPRVAAPEEVEVHAVFVKPDAGLNDLPYPAEWATAHDITSQDWATFVNFLIPHHASARNEALMGEKQGGGSAAPSEAVSEKAASGTAPHDPADPAQAMRRRAELEATIQQWNDGFFGPRGVKIQLETAAAELPRMPGAWDSAPLDASTNTATAGSSSAGQRDIGGPSSAAGGNPPRRGWWEAFSNLKMDDEGVRFGNSFVADNRGLRIGGLVMDDRGIHYGNRTFGRPPSASFGPGPSRGFGPGFFGPPPRRAAAFGATYGNSTDAVDERGRRGGRRGGARSRSSSTSSSSSSSSSSSESSIGSLPDYDDLRDEQLPTFSERLSAWTAAPQVIRTKADVRQLKTDLKAIAKNRDSRATASSIDRTALRAQIKALQKQWRAIKKEQHKDTRRLRRERKQQRREERRQRVQQRREERREGKRASREQRRHRRGGSDSFVGPVHGCPPPMAGPSTGFPPAFGHRGRGWGGGRGRGRGCRGGGGFFSPNHTGANWSLGANGPHGPMGPHGMFGSRDAGSSSTDAPGPFGARYPGSWPGEFDDETIPPPGASAVKYSEAQNLGTELQSRRADLDAAAERGMSDGERRAAEKELEAMMDKMEQLRVEADEAYARELATHHHQG